MGTTIIAQSAPKSQRNLETKALKNGTEVASTRDRSDNFQNGRDLYKMAYDYIIVTYAYGIMVGAREAQEDDEEVRHLLG